MEPCSFSSLSSPAIAAAAILPAGPLFSVREPAVLTHAAKQKSRIKKKKTADEKARIKKKGADKKKRVADKKKVADKKQKSRG